MLSVLAGIVLSALPRRWRAALDLDQAISWVSAAILSAILEALFAFVAMVWWYSHSVTTWAAAALDSALHNGPGGGYDPHLLGLSAFVIWWIHPLTWVLATFFIEGLVRMVAAIATEQILPLWPLAVADWCYGKATHRPLEGDALHTPTGKEQVRAMVSAVKQSARTARLPEVADELVEATEGADAVLEIHSCRPKADWSPPRVVRIAKTYYRLESACEGAGSRPFMRVPVRP